MDTKLSSTRRQEILDHLAEIKAKREAFLKLREEAAVLAAEWIPLAAAEMALTDVAARAGLSRQAVYNILRDGNDNDQGH